MAAVRRAATHVNDAAAALALDAVIESVFDQRLQRQLQRRGIGNCGVNFHAVAQNVAIAHLLHGQVAAHMFHFIGDGYPVLALAQRDTKETRERLHERNDLILLARFGLPDDGVERVVEEVGVDLCLEHLELGFFQLRLLIDFGVEQVANLPHHEIETDAQLRQLVGVCVSDEGSHIALRNLRGGVVQPFDGQIDAFGDIPGRQNGEDNHDDEHQHNRHCPNHKIALDTLPLEAHTVDLKDHVVIKQVLHQGGNAADIVERHLGFGDERIGLNLGAQFFNLAAQRFACAQDDIKLDAATVRVCCRHQLADCGVETLDQFRLVALGKGCLAGNNVPHSHVEIGAKRAAQLVGGCGAAEHGSILAIELERAQHEEARDRADEHHDDQKREQDLVANAETLAQEGRFGGARHPHGRAPNGLKWDCAHGILPNRIKMRRCVSIRRVHPHPLTAAPPGNRAAACR